MDEKDHSIRFINSNYDTLFRIPDGGIVEVRFPDRAFSAKCEYLDDYHTMVGDTVFHICEFAEMVERQGGFVRPELETMLDKAAWGCMAACPPGISDGRAHRQRVPL